MAQQKVQLRKTRDFGENINDTFQFIKQEFKPLFLSFLSIAGIFILAEAILIGLFYSKFFGLTMAASRNGGQLSQDDTSSMIFSTNYFLMIALSFLTLEIMYATVASYMKAYLLKGDSPVFQEVWDVFKKYILRVLLFSIVAWIMIIIGCFFCLVPGIYFMVVLAPFEMIIFMEDASFNDALGRCFALIRENFWMSFGIYIVVYLISYMGGGIVGFISALIGGLISYFSTKDVSSVAGIASSFFLFTVYFFLIIFFVSICLNYFSLVEKLDGTGVLERVQMLGADDDGHPNTEEEF